EAHGEVRLKILISSIGTRGEVQPILALALELKALGHDPTLCVAPTFKPWVESSGIRCIPLGVDVKQFMSRAAAAAAAPGARRRKPPWRRQLRKRVPHSVREQSQVVGDAARAGCDLIVVCGGIQSAGRSIAEKLRIPYVYATYCPNPLPSPDHPPPLIH